MQTKRFRLQRTEDFIRPYNSKPFDKNNNNWSTAVVHIMPFLEMSTIYDQLDLETRKPDKRTERFGACSE